MPTHDRRPSLGRLREHVDVPTLPYLIIDPADGTEPLSSAEVLETITQHHLGAIEHTAYDIAQVLMRNADGKAVTSMRNLIKAARARAVIRAQKAFLLPSSPASVVAARDDDLVVVDEALQVVIALLQDVSGDETPGIDELAKQQSRESMSPLAHGTYILLVTDTLVEELIGEVLSLIRVLLDQHSAKEDLYALFAEVAIQHRSNLRGFLRRKGVWV